jgi:hypothetical protein
LTLVAPPLYRSPMFRITLPVLLLVAWQSLLLTQAKAAQSTSMPPVADLPVHPDMPDPLIANDGQKITNLQQWRTRREEMEAIIEEYEFGHAPPPPGNVSGREIVSKVLADGKTQYRAVHLSFGPDQKLGFDIGIFSPAGTGGAGPFPTIVHLNYFPIPGTAPAATAPTTRRSFFRAMTSDAMAAQYSAQLGRGYAVVTINYQQLGADNNNYRQSAFFPAYPNYDWRDISAWTLAWARPFYWPALLTNASPSSPPPAADAPSDSAAKTVAENRASTKSWTKTQSGLDPNSRSSKARPKSCRSTKTG